MKRLFLLLLIFVSLAVGQQLPNIKNFGLVDDGIYRGAQPSPTNILELYNFGINTILDLRGDKTVAREKIVVEALSNSTKQITFINVPLNGLKAPTKEQIAQLLKILETAKRPIFFHCQHGQDRTGTLAALWRMSHDNWSNEKALQEAKFYHINPLQFSMRHLISHWVSFNTPTY